jgi:hypothetical protein
MPLYFDYAIHSGFLIHWTGKDIDLEYDQTWYESDKSKSNKSCSEAYIERLTNILKYGLWMTEDLKNKKRESDLSFNGKTISIPPIARTSFTELKLSDSRNHAKEYGRLGIGVKRPFVLDRLGRPIIYFHEKRIDEFFMVCLDKIKDTNLLNFFKPMSSRGTPQTFDWYAESEWRIIFLEKLINNKYILDPRDKMNIDEYNYYYRDLTPEQQKHLRYLIPLDCWFSMIIYPSLLVKNKAQNSDEIRKLIKKIKDRVFFRHCPGDEIKNQPIELDLDACRNF